MIDLDTPSKNIGIDQMGFYTPHYYLSHDALAIAREVDPLKFSKGLGQFSMAVPAPDEDIVTMAANAVSQMPADDLKDISWVLFANRVKY